MITSIVDPEQIVNNELRQDGGDAAMEIVRCRVVSGYRLSPRRRGVARAIVDGTLYRSRKGAEAADLVWAAKCGCDHALYRAGVQGSCVNARSIGIVPLR